MLELKIQTQIIKYLKSKGYIAVKNITISINGWPDVTAIAPNGKHIYIEVKRPGGRLSEIQKIRIQQLREHNTDVYVVTSLDQLKGELK